MHHKRNIVRLLIFLLTALILVACGGPDEGGAVLSVTIFPTATAIPTTIVEVASPTAITSTEATAATATVVATATATTEATATEGAAAATAEPAPTEPTRPQSLVTRIRFPAGATSDTVSGRVGAGQRDVYLFRALAAQAASLSLTSAGNAANFTLSGLDDGQFHKPAGDPARQWAGTLPLTQDYIVVVTAPTTTGYSLALAITPLPATGSIRGLVYQDSNRDNLPGDDEPVGGAPVRLLGGVECSSQIAQTTTTAAGGAYAFYDLPAGTYCVEAVLPELTLSSLVELGEGEDAVDVNLVWPGPAPTGSIRGLVYQDTNRDNQPGDDEPVNGAPVRLLGGAECTAQLAQTTTAIGGAYAFYDLPAGTYCVEAVLPELILSSLVELGEGEEAVDVNLVWPGPETSD